LSFGYFLGLQKGDDCDEEKGFEMVSEDLEFCVFYSCLFADIYWKNEHRLMCTSDICTAAERDRYEKSVSLSFFFFLFLFSF
jgi:hypothetical protein